jgi:serine/threonine protein kinase
MGMDTDPILNRCPKCQSPLPADAPQGLCPKCLLAAVATPTEAGQPAGNRPKPPPLEEIAAAFPQLEILEFFGQGGMGFVFKARQPKLDRLVALKILPQSLAADPTFAERFNREARLLARLNHPGIVTVHDFGSVQIEASVSGGGGESGKVGGGESERETSLSKIPPAHFPTFPLSPGQTQASSEGPARLYYLLMEFVDGVNLRQAMQAGRFTPEQALAIVPKICEALQFAHNEGILHRDIKPENILLDAKGRVKIADFGIAKLMGDVGQAFQPAGAGDFPVARSEAGNTGLELRHSSRAASPVNWQAGKPALRPDALTEAGKTLGTPNYMAPEQLENAGEVDHRADIYSLGVVFYEMLTGELPLGRFAPPSQKSAADPRVDEVVLRALEKEKARRYASAEEVRTQVETLVTGSSRREEAPIEGGSNIAEGGKPRFSRMAIVGAVWAAAGALHFLVPTLGYRMRSEFVPIMMLVLGLSAPFGTTILGWVAVWQIRRSAGRLRGMALALFDALAFPLLLFDGAVLFAGLGLVGSRFMAPEVLRSPLFVTLALCVVAVMDYFIARAIWSAVVPPAAAPAAAAKRVALTRALIGVGCLLLICGNYFYMSRRNAEIAPLNNARQLALACLMYASDHTNQLPAKRDDVKGYGGINLDPSKFTLVATGKLDQLPQPADQAILFRTTTPDSKGRYVIGFADGHVEWKKLNEARVVTTRSPAAAEPRSNYAFGPEVRLQLNSMATGSGYYDFDNAESCSHQTWDQWELLSGAFTEWALQKGMDFGFFTNQTSHAVELAGFDLGVYVFPGTQPSSVETETTNEWNSLSAGRLLEQELHGLLTNGEPRILLGTTNFIGRTLAFRTREGGMGLLQITGFTENPRGVKLRYKLVQALGQSSAVRSSPTQQGRVISQAPFVAQLPVGEVELLGVSEFQKSTDPSRGTTHNQRAVVEKTWWRPNGSPLNQKIPCFTGGLNQKGRDTYEIALRVRGQTNGVPGVEIEKLPGTGAYDAGLAGATWARRVEDMTYQKVLSCEPGLTQVSFRIGVATEVWRDELPPKGFSSETQAGALGNIMLSVIASGDETTVACQYDERTGWQTRLIALGPKGEVEPVRLGPLHGLGNNTSVTRIYRTDAIKDTKLHLQRRPYRWVEFHNVSLKPGQRTQVAVVGEVTKTVPRQSNAP